MISKLKKLLIEHKQIGPSSSAVAHSIATTTLSKQCHFCSVILLYARDCNFFLIPLCSGIKRLIHISLVKELTSREECIFYLRYFAQLLWSKRLDSFRLCFIFLQCKLHVGV